MKPRHAAALALVGWYLMVPPLVQNPKGYTDANLVATDAPLSQWTMLSGFDFASQCERALGAIMKNAQKNIDRIMLSGKRDDRTLERLGGLLREEQAHCIASDDPRLRDGLK